MHETPLAANDPDEVRRLTEEARRHLAHLRKEVRKAVQDDPMLALGDIDGEGSPPGA